MGDGLGRLVGSQAVEHRVAHHTLAGHFGIGDFAHQLRLEPLRATCIGCWGCLGQRAFIGFQLLQLLVQALQRCMVEAGADLAGVTQLALVVVQAEQQRAKPVRVPFGWV